MIHDGDSWCLLIESKVQASLTEDQLIRHERTLRRRGFDRITSVALTKANVTTRQARPVTWVALYEWAGATGHGEWCQRLRAYFRAAEIRLAREQYLTEGTLTMFDGFQFSADNPYSLW